MYLRVFALILVVLVTLVSSRASAQGITVEVDGAVVAFDQPPMVIGGRLLIPLRGVFERLGAEVEWRPESQLVVAQRGPTTIVLRPGVTSARVNGQPVSLDVPAMIVRGRTLVPLRFVGEALGASVDWDPSRRLVFVTSGPSAGGPPPAPVRRVRPRAPAQFVGTVVQVDRRTSPQRLHVRTDGAVMTFPVTPSTVVFVTEVATGRGGAVSLGQIRRGDLVEVTVDGQGQATEIRGSYRELVGRLNSLTTGLLYLSNGQALSLAHDALFIMGGRQVTRNLFRQGMELTLRLNPQTNEVWEVRALGVGVQPVQPQPYVGPLRIDGVSHNATAPLGVGATLVVSMRGTPGGIATFDVGSLDTGLPMVEGPAGEYTGRRVIHAGEAVSGTAVTVHLRAGGVAAVRHSGAVVIDGLAPRFTRRSPEQDTVVANQRPTIVVEYVDRGPSGVNDDSLRMWVNGHEVRPIPQSATTAYYLPPAPLPLGRNAVQARIKDAAGNQAEVVWAFEVVQAVGPAPAPTVVAPGPPPVVVQPVPPPVVVSPPAAVSPRIAAVSLNATGPLGIGATLVVTIQGTPGGNATFDVARLESGLPMVEGPAGQYTGRRVIRAGEAADGATVTVHLRVGGVAAVRQVGNVAIDGQAPEFTQRVPGPDAVVTQQQPTIVVGFVDRGPSGVIPASARLWVNGREVQITQRTPTSVSYVPPAPLPLGRIGLQARVADAAGNEANTVWAFTVQAAAQPAPQPTRTVRENVPPNPPPPGFAKPTPPGQGSGVGAPTIVAPRPEDKILSPLVIRGTAPDGLRVQVTVEIRAEAANSPTMALDPITVQATGGKWEIRVNLPSPLPPSGRLTVTAVTIGPGGAQSTPVRVVVTLPPRELERP